MNKKKRPIYVAKEECVACGECLSTCRKKAVSIAKGIFAVIHEERCISCALCAKKCPADAIKAGEAL